MRRDASVCIILIWYICPVYYIALKTNEFILSFVFDQRWLSCFQNCILLFLDYFPSILVVLFPFPAEPAFFLVKKKRERKGIGVEFYSEKSVKWTKKKNEKHINTQSINEFV